MSWNQVMGRAAVSFQVFGAGDALHALPKARSTAVVTADIVIGTRSSMIHSLSCG
jgi:hypothetical protein